MLAIVASIAIVVMRFFPDTVVANVLRRYLVDCPMRFVSQLRRVDFIRFVLVCVIVFAAGEMASIFLPDLMLLAADLSLMIDGILVSLALAAASRLRITSHAVRTTFLPSLQYRLRLFRAAARERRTRGHRALEPDNDDERTISVIEIAA